MPIPRYAILLAIPFLVMACVLLSGCSRSSRDMVEAFFLDIGRGAEQEAVERFSPTLQAQFGTPALTRAVRNLTRRMNAHGGLKHVKAHGAIAVFTDIALYDVTLSFADGSRTTLQTSAIRIDGVWYVNAAL